MRFFFIAGKKVSNNAENISANNAKISPTKKSPMKINNNLKPPSSSSNKSLKSSPARTPIKSIKSDAVSPEKQKSKDASETKSFIAFTEVPDESQLNDDACKSEGGTADSKEGIDIVL